MLIIKVKTFDATSGKFLNPTPPMAVPLKSLLHLFENSLNRLAQGQTSKSNLSYLGKLVNSGTNGPSKGKDHQNKASKSLQGHLGPKVSSPPHLNSLPPKINSSSLYYKNKLKEVHAGGPPYLHAGMGNHENSLTSTGNSPAALSYLSLLFIY